ncbi:MAG: hypothetical protein CFE26_23775, partial [Verrucomicrobiales bacterium VVV1]
GATLPSHRVAQGERLQPYRRTERAGEPLSDAASNDAAETVAADAALMARVREGDARAVAALRGRGELPVKRFVARIVFNAAEAEELAQETMVRVWQQRGKFRDGAAVRPWIFAIAVNLARNRLRWWRRRPMVALDAWSELAAPVGGEGSAGMARDERAAAVRTAVAALPLELRE